MTDLADVNIIPYSATATSILARFIFMYLLYTKKSTNNLSLLFSVMNIASSSMWLDYSLKTQNTPIFVRSVADVSLFTISAGYIVMNKWVTPDNS